MEGKREGEGRGEGRGRREGEGRGEGREKGGEEGRGRREEGGGRREEGGTKSATVASKMGDSWIPRVVRVDEKVGGRVSTPVISLSTSLVRLGKKSPTIFHI
jgi:hypothetical protein